MSDVEGVVDIFDDDIRPMSPSSHSIKRIRVEIGLQNEEDSQDVRPMSPPRGDALLLRSFINGEKQRIGTPFLKLTPINPVYGLLSEEGGLAMYNDRLKQEALRRKGSGKARAVMRTRPY